MAIAAACLGLSSPAGCGREAPRPSPVQPAPIGGRSPLLADPDAVVVLQHPGTLLPESVARQLASRAPEASWTLEPHHWAAHSLGGMLEAGPRASALAETFAVLFGSERPGAWLCSPPVALESDVATWRLRNGRHALEHVRRGSHEAWIDQQAARVYWWDADRRALSCIGRTAPSSLQILADLSDSDLQRLEPAALGARPPREGTDLYGLWTLLGERRPALAAPTPTRLARPIDRLGPAHLIITAGVSQAFFRPAREFVLRTTESTRRAMFAVEWAHAGESTTLWSEELGSDQGWVTRQVELPSDLDGSGSLVLRTSPAKGAPAAYAAWAECRLLDVSPPPPARPHIVLIDIDTLRADRLGCYGHDRDTSPGLDAWARQEATLYLDALATANWTLPSTLSMLTGLDVHQHGVRDETASLDDSLPTVASLLKAVGYRTMALTGGGYVIPDFGFAQGFDRFKTRATGLRAPSRSHWQEALEWLTEPQQPEPLFLFIQTYEVHAPLHRDRHFDDPDQPYRGRLDSPLLTEEQLLAARRHQPLDGQEVAWVSGLYDAAVRRMDLGLSSFLGGLKEVFGETPYMVIITSDHGEELFDRGTFGHRQSLFQELLRVPLIIRYPAARSEVVSGRPASLVDIVPTILEVAGAAVPSALPGASLRSGETGKRLRVADDRGLAAAILHDGYKLIRPLAGRADDAAPRLYHIPADPAELSDLSDGGLPMVRRLTGLWESHQRRYAAPAQRAQRPGELSPESIADLQQLGYFAAEADEDRDH